LHHTRTCYTRTPAARRILLYAHAARRLSVTHTTHEHGMTLPLSAYTVCVVPQRDALRAVACTGWFLFASGQQTAFVLHTEPTYYRGCTRTADARYMVIVGDAYCLQCRRQHITAHTQPGWARGAAPVPAALLPYQLHKRGARVGSMLLYRRAFGGLPASSFFIPILAAVCVGLRCAAVTFERAAPGAGVRTYNAFCAHTRPCPTLLAWLHFAPGPSARLQFFCVLQRICALPRHAPYLRAANNVPLLPARLAFPGTATICELTMGQHLLSRVVLDVKFARSLRSWYDCFTTPPTTTNIPPLFPGYCRRTRRDAFLFASTFLRAHNRCHAACAACQALRAGKLCLALILLSHLHFLNTRRTLL